MKHVFTIALAAFLGVVGLVAQQDVQPPPAGTTSPLAIVEPTDQSVLTGPSIIRAAVTGTSKATTSVEFFVDGARVCIVQTPPFECAFDAGARLTAKLVRVTANFADGTRVVESVRTRSLDVSQSTGVDAVLVPVVVTDWQGHFVKNLRPDSFHVFEDGGQQTITSLQSENVPVDVVVAVDISGSMADDLPKLKQTVKRFLATLNSIDHVTILAFNDRTYLVAKRDADSATRAAAVDALKAFGGTALYDAILRGIDLFGHEISRKAMVVFTDGNDLNSLAPIDPVEKRIRESEATLYIITQGKGPRAEAVRKVVNRLADVSGGRAFPTEKIDQLERTLGSVLDDLTHQYLVGYTPTNTAHDGSYRKITVTTNDRSDTVRAREGYRAALN